MTVHEYITHINQLYLTGNAREHSYRSDLQVLISTILPDVLVTNEPARVSCGAPDYMLARKDIPVGYIEAKDIGVDLDHKNLKEQFDRYKAGLSNLIITDYLQFRFYKDGEFITDIRIGKIENGAIIPLTENFNQFTHLIKDFTSVVSQSIKSPSRLATMMAGKARLMADVIEKSLNFDDISNTRSNLKSQMISFKQMLIHDITNKSFADIYAQTIAYGMFAARYHDPTLETFSRTEAAQLIPKSNPFLRKLFQDIAGYDLDDRLVWIVDELVNIFLASDVSQIMKNFGKSTRQDDPVVHFYETFLGEYNPKLRKARGVWYTPQPVVNFIVRAVDDILKDNFHLEEGIADTSKTNVTVKVPTHDKRFSSGYRDYEQEVHRVQILDAATGTGTFLAEVVRHIYQKFEGQQGIWSQYVKKDLIPRLNGFELLMASYAMAHLKMDMLLTETGYKSDDDQRLRIYLTNSLEEAHPDSNTLFSSWLSDEANQANIIKRDTPVMCVIGNPPYSVSSTNKNKWIDNLMVDYKKNLNERNIQPLSDDYIKFIRYGQHYIDKNGSGVLTYISNNSFIDGMIHRQMRESLSTSFDEIYIIDLHGSTKKNEKTDSGDIDKNVFDIQQGVSINIFIKTSRDEELAKVKHFDLLGSREFKYNFLSENSLKDILWTDINLEAPHYFFVPKNFDNRKQYKGGFQLTELMEVQACGMVTARDSLLVKFSRSELEGLLSDFINLPESEFRTKHNLPKDSRDWTYKNAKEDLKNAAINDVDYRPFDTRFVPYSPNSKGILSYPRNEIMREMIGQENYGLLVCKQQSTFDFQHVFITRNLSDKCSLSSQTKEAGYHFPLYLHHSKGDDSLMGLQKTPNINSKIVKRIEEIIKYVFLPNETTVCDLEPGYDGTFSPLDLLDYVYAVLHSPEYRSKYKEFFKIDFPMVPFPDNADHFWKLVELGEKMRKYHLMEHQDLNRLITKFPEDGNNVITRNLTKSSPGFVLTSSDSGQVWINDQQYFDNVPEAVWNFYIGGYQPAQKWLKDRKGREMGYTDIIYYQKMIVAIKGSIELMEAIDVIGVEPSLESVN